jgi:hypothetical protein
MCNPVENLEVASDPILEPFALTGEQSNNRADDSLARVKNAEQQVHVLPDAIAMSTHGSVHFTLGGRSLQHRPWRKVWHSLFISA